MSAAFGLGTSWEWDAYDGIQRMSGTACQLMSAGVRHLLQRPQVSYFSACHVCSAMTGIAFVGRGGIAHGGNFFACLLMPCHRNRK